MRRVVILGWVVSCGLVLACGKKDGPDPVPLSPSGSSGSTASTGRVLGEDCREDADCASGLCLKTAVYTDDPSFCQQTCSSDADCSGTFPVCGVGPDGGGLCGPSCDNLFNSFTCRDGVPVACNSDEALCDDCGCPDGLRCDPGVGCTDLSDEGGPCQMDSDCRTGNCSPSFGVCRVPVGSACTADNCDSCIANASGYSYCSRECEYDIQCNGGLCLFYGSGAFYGECYQACDGVASCPGTCEGIADSDATFCQCTDCTLLAAPRPLGSLCHGADECDSGTCYMWHECKPACNYYGICTQTCAASSDCGGDLSCAPSGCIDASCSPLCLPPCNSFGLCEDGYFCRQVTTTEGDAVSVCDILFPDGHECTDPSDCQSMKCEQGYCAPLVPVKQGNGGGCDSAEDCQSANCVGGTCRGSALLGDACAAEYDCSAGTCCTSGQNAGKCATFCN